MNLNPIFQLECTITEFLRIAVNFNFRLFLAKLFRVVVMSIGAYPFFLVQLPCSYLLLFFLLVQFPCSFFFQNASFFWCSFLALFCSAPLFLLVLFPCSFFCGSFGAVSLLFSGIVLYLVSRNVGLVLRTKS